jgi:hypothetical protein
MVGVNNVLNVEEALVEGTVGGPENGIVGALEWDIINIPVEAETGGPLGGILGFSLKVMTTTGIQVSPKGITWDPGWEGDTLC